MGLIFSKYNFCSNGNSHAKRQCPGVKFDNFANKYEEKRKLMGITNKTG